MDHVSFKIYVEKKKERLKRLRKNLSIFVHTNDVLYYNESRKRGKTYMDVIIYLLIVCLIMYIVITLLPIILPIVAILLIALTIFGWYLKHKIQKQLNDAEKSWENETYYHQETRNSSDDIIDVEFTEREDD